MKLNKLQWKQYGRIAIFIDAANIIYSCRDLGWQIKYKRLKEYFEKNVRLIDIHFYFAKREESQKDDKFLGVLAQLGFELKVRRLKIFSKKNGSRDTKGNVDGELIVDMLRLHKQFDTAVLMSGDSDFVHAVKYLRELGKRVIVISSRGHVAKELIDTANKFLYLNDFKKDWSFK